MRLIFQILGEIAVLRGKVAVLLIWRSGGGLRNLNASNFKVERVKVESWTRSSFEKLLPQVRLIFEVLPQVRLIFDFGSAIS